MLKITLLLVGLTVMPGFGKHRILMNRIGASGAELFIANADGSGERKLLSTSGFDYNASYSADGKWIVFTSERNGSADLYKVKSDGTGVERLTDNPAYDDQASFANDGREIAFVSSREGGHSNLWILDAASHKAKRLTKGV